MTRPPLTSLRVLLPHLRPYLGRAIAASLALLVAAGLLLGLGQGLRQLIDQGFGSASPASLNGAALAMFLIVAALGASTALRFYLVSWLGERVAGDLRRAVFNHVLSLSPAYFETARTGDILSRLTADIAVLAKLYAEAIENAEKKQAEGIAAAGGSPTLVMRFGILPQVAPIMLGHALYFFESNTRSASILGVVGAGGIGLQIAERIRVRHWDEVAFIIIMMVMMVMAIDWLSRRLRQRLIGG